MLEQLRTYMEKQNLDGFFVQNHENVRYISGYTSDDAYLLITRGRQFLITDPRYTEHAQAECPDYTILNWRGAAPNVGEYAAQLAEQEGLKAVGFEKDLLTVKFHEALCTAPHTEWIGTEGVIEEFRSVKTPEEIEKLKVACDIASRAFERIIRDIRVGVTEKELASRLSHYMVMEGSDTKPYGNILISGARTSLLHGIPSSKAVEYGDFVLMDYGCQYKGYLSDMTRTVVVGKASAKQREVYELEQKMVAACEEQMKAGNSGRMVYEASTAVIQDTEYFPYHYTGIGHGIGLFVHEIPFMGPKHETPFKVNQVITVEPGIYIPGWGGGRIEDQVLIQENGCVNLVSATKELIEL